MRASRGNVLVVAGENRLTGQSRDASIQALAQVGHPDYEVPLGPTIPAYYGLVASRYMHEYGVTRGRPRRIRGADARARLHAIPARNSTIPSRLPTSWPRSRWRCR